MFNEKGNPNESYVVLVVDVDSREIFNVLVPTRKALANMMTLMPSDGYVIGKVTVVTCPKDYDEFIRELVTGGKPEDLNFGQFNL